MNDWKTNHPPPSSSSSSLSSFYSHLNNHSNNSSFSNNNTNNNQFLSSSLSSTFSTSYFPSSSSSSSFPFPFSSPSPLPITFPNLTYLDFKGCHNLSNSFICAMIESSPSLQLLRLHNIIDVNQYVLEKIVKHCPALYALSLSQCHALTDEAITYFLKKKQESQSNFIYIYI